MQNEWNEEYLIEKRKELVQRLVEKLIEVKVIKQYHSVE